MSTIKTFFPKSKRLKLVLSLAVLLLAVAAYFLVFYIVDDHKMLRIYNSVEEVQQAAVNLKDYSAPDTLESINLKNPSGVDYYKLSKTDFMFCGKFYLNGLNTSQSDAQRAQLDDKTLQQIKLAGFYSPGTHYYNQFVFRSASIFGIDDPRADYHKRGHNCIIFSVPLPPVGFADSVSDKGEKLSQAVIGCASGAQAYAVRVEAQVGQIMKQDTYYQIRVSSSAGYGYHNQRIDLPTTYLVGAATNVISRSCGAEHIENVKDGTLITMYLSSLSDLYGSNSPTPAILQIYR